MKSRPGGRVSQIGTRWLKLMVVGLGVLSIAGLFLANQPVEKSMSDDQKREKIASLYKKYTRKFPDVEGIKAADLLEDIEASRDLVLVDVRKPAEQEVSMIPGAITQKEFESSRESYAGKTVVTYCTAGYRSGLYAQKLQKKGWDVLNLEGSLLSWTHVGGPLVDGEGPTRRIHVYSADWSLQAQGYEPTW